VRRLAIVLVVATLAVVGAVPASGAAPAAPTYVALGDSYTAGPFVPNQLLDQLGCLRSDHNYPHLVAQAKGWALRDPSCSGAVTDDLSSPQPILGGVNPPQLDALVPGAAVVSLQMGGNDIGFTEILVRCATLLPFGTPCRDLYTQGGTDQLAARVAAAATKVGAALAEIRRRAPGARLLVVGYPAILPDVAPGCWPLLPVAPGDVPYLRSIEKALNAALAAQAASAGAAFVDTYTPSIGHDACQLPGTRWVEPVLPLAPAAPVHPNSLGMAGMAAAVLAALP
jgi:lysophospholipase L1-like esterase